MNEQKYSRDLENFHKWLFPLKSQWYQNHSYFNPNIWGDPLENYQNGEITWMCLIGRFRMTTHQIFWSGVLAESTIKSGKSCPKFNLFFTLVNSKSNTLQRKKFRTTSTQGMFTTSLTLPLSTQATSLSLVFQWNLRLILRRLSRSGGCPRCIRHRRFRKTEKRGNLFEYHRKSSINQADLFWAWMRVLQKALFKIQSFNFK